MQRSERQSGAYGEAETVQRYSRFDRRRQDSKTQDTNLRVKSQHESKRPLPQARPRARVPAGATRGKWLIFGIASVCVLGTGSGVLMKYWRPMPAPNLSETNLRGTWRLQSINKDAVGPNVDSVVIMQEIAFNGGKLHGETRLRGDSTAASTSMPFPDETVSAVVPGADGHEVTVTWDGTYTLLDSKRLELHVGKAKYLVGARLDPAAHRLALDHDAVLTFPGIAQYAVAPAAQP